MNKGLEALEILNDTARFGEGYGNIDKQAYLILKEALERNEPMKPIYEKDGTRSCPCCKGNWLTPNFKFCSDCGQKLDWDDER
ncbi:MAG: hypothetical protein M0R38_10075 [Bacteroidia bacterium]|nr:hypothetical protein [Bacteroidia bacterium]